MRKFLRQLEAAGIVFGLLILIAVAVGGCGTLAGLGEDLTSLSNGIAGKQSEKIAADRKYRPIVP